MEVDNFLYFWQFFRHRDFTCGYTALHWACKHGNLDMVKLLAGTYQVTKSRQTHVNSTLKQIPYKYVAGQHWRANTWRLHTSSHRRPAQSSRGFWPVGWCIQGWCQCEGLCWQKTEAVHDGAGISTCWFLSFWSYWTHFRGLKVWAWAWAMTLSGLWKTGTDDSVFQYYSNYMFC